ncbi:hypothetical protein [Bacteroides acidifaciens]|uniref:Uncharacterized protein n=3 Tax=Bacteroidales TaxID=171549 RepID=A0A7K3MGP6_9BACE|nr:hypothetical protein [Bacteroides acidifaciens]NBH93178.1 hypothetical protein [Muribaculaceae bacterium S4]NBI21496.1 hypothetical protein [Muribaculaceae bacterium Z1]MBF0728616.1 hypothetical protein [Bacteroides acidifaciens]MBF0834004.1 hypothetical protein [Bacteroides acidifaciens]NDO53597.1 hypothetical protein [Bacteroides acidifaciens]
MASRRTIIQDWMVAQKCHHLSDMQVQMARELGFKPDSLRKIDNHKQEPWKTPLPQHIENLYEKRFKRQKPEVVKSLRQQLIEDEIKRKAKKKAKDARRAAKAAEESQCSPEVIEDSEDIVQLGLDSCGD